ncbi:hypothetical protein ACSBR1_022134 [Camellia fascicularis]
MKKGSHLASTVVLLRDAGAVACDLNSAEIKGDNKDVIRLCVSEDAPPWECGAIFKDIKRLVTQGHFSFHWSPRTANKAAHWVSQTSLYDADLVVHTARPFQQVERCTVLEATVKTKTAYVNICDDTTYAWRAKSYMSKTLAANIPAITTGGVYPRVSNMMAAESVRAARSESKGEPERLRFSYYTAGTGGAGPTILATSFLLLGKEVVAYSKGEKIKLKPYIGMLNIDFGKGIGKSYVYLLNLPEVKSAHEVLRVPTVSARFGTAPFFWNWGMEVMTNFLPAEFLRDRIKVQNLVEQFDPVVRVVDGIAGERVSMRVNLECADGRSTLALFSHKRLSVGTATAAFALAILEGSTQPGVWFPEEPEGIAIEAREALLKRAAQGTINFVMNKPLWMVETDPKELSLGIYL